jgi:hypothetical protein
MAPQAFKSIPHQQKNPKPLIRKNSRATGASEPVLYVVVNELARPGLV